MVDPLAQLAEATKELQKDEQIAPKIGSIKQQNTLEPFPDSTPSSLSGTLRLNAQTANIFKESEDLEKRLASMMMNEKTQVVVMNKSNCDKSFLQTASSDDKKIIEKGKSECDLEMSSPMTGKNPQMILMKMIFCADGRVIKYVILFTVFGYLMAPMNFVFLSMEEVCKEKGYNFSQLAGAVLISQATIETIAFLIVPSILSYISRSLFLTLGFLMMALRFFFYAGWYYTADVSVKEKVIGQPFSSYSCSKEY